MKHHKRLFLILTSTIILLITVAGSFWFYQRWSNNPIEAENNLAIPLGEQTGTRSLQSIIHDAQKSVVQITVKTENSERTGSGFLYNSLGDIITNAHVIKDALSITVTMSNAETYNAAIVGSGETTDIAVIRVPQLINNTSMNISSSSLTVGDEIIAVGSPLGFQNSVSIGIISGLNRSFEVDGFNYEDVYQISANITNGNSGGPLIHRATGEVVGINSAGITDSDIAFSIPIQQVIEQTREWSNSISNDELVFPSTSIDLEHDPSQIKEDAVYLVNYFLESLQIRDYINAYTLLGSELQTETSYTEFRELYVHQVSVTINETNVTFSETLEQATIDTNLEITLVSDDGPKQWNYSFTVGYENDQLKILQLQKTEA